MKRILLVWLFIGLLLPAGIEAAEGISYNYVQVGYSSGEVDDGPDFDGLGLAASFEVGSTLHIVAAYDDSDYDTFQGIDIDATSWSAGIGLHRDVGGRASFFAEAGYVDVELDSNIGDLSDDGLFAGIGIRGLVSSRVELAGGVTYVDLDEGGDDTSFGASILFNANEVFSVGVGYSTSDDISALTVGARIYWGK